MKSPVLERPTSLSKRDAFADLPPAWPDDLSASNRVAASSRTLVVLDDDPTGTQTVSDVAVVTRWDAATLTAELATAPACFYILTNSRSLTPDSSHVLHRELAENLRSAAAATGRVIVVASRSDSTLRGHFPLETDTLAEVLGSFDATLIIPYFEAGGRFTLNDTHYVTEGDRLLPVAETAFAQDAAFGYRHSHLPSWIEEKTVGRVSANDVVSFSIDLLRRGGPAAVAHKLRSLPSAAVCVVNACAPHDIEVFAAGTLAAEQAGSRFLYRTAASFVAARIGQRHSGVLPSNVIARPTANGGLVVVGSHVPKTTAQLGHLLLGGNVVGIELPVPALLDPACRATAIRTSLGAANRAIADGRDTVLYTSRDFVASANRSDSLETGRQISEALITVVRGLAVAPRYLIAKGGITSSDIATQALGVRRAQVLGQALPGVPVWQLGAETIAPGLGYVVFPGNVGDDLALLTLVQRLARR